MSFAAFENAPHTHFGERYMLVRSMIFYPMLWLRGVFLPIAQIIGGFFALSSLVMALLAHAFIVALLMGLSAFGTFMLRQKYDSILLDINPTGHELHLWQ
jgi:hypothetical protein